MSSPNGLQFTERRWVEMYYAIVGKLGSPAVEGDEAWVSELREIADTIADNVTV